MGQPVKVSDELLLDARVVGAIVERSIASQIDFWAKLGRAIEPLLHGDRILALCRAGAVQPLSACLQSVDTPEGRERALNYLKSQPYPHYEPVPNSPGLVVRIDASGTRTQGRFVNREFRPAGKARKTKNR